MTAVVHLSALPLVHALGWMLLHFCWQGALVAILLACALGVLPSSASRLRYSVACAAMALMVALPAITFARLASNKQPQSQSLSIAVTAQSFDRALDTSLDPTAEPWRMRLESIINQSLPAVISLWLAGVLILVCRLNLGLIATRRLKSFAVEPAPAEIQNVLRALRIRLGIQRAVTLLNSTRLQAPSVIGWLRPAILLPLGCMAGLSRLQVEAILAHELAHIRRHDYLVSLFQSVTETVLFYHPAVWWISNQIRREREHCCDDLAVAVCGDRLAYAKALSFLEERRSPLPIGAFGATGGVLKMRIARLLGLNQSPVFPRAAAVVLLVLAGATAGLSFWGSARAQSPALQQATAEQSSFAKSPQVPENGDSFKLWLNQDVVWIIAPDEKQAYLRLSSDQQRAEFIRQFWEKRNPNPGRPENKFREEHYRRLAYANLHFATKAEPGWATDRGRTYIVYGAPDSIDAYPSGGSGSVKHSETWHYPSTQVEGLTARNQNESGGAPQTEANVDFRFVDDCSCGNYQLQLPAATTGAAARSGNPPQPARLVAAAQTNQAAANASAQSAASPTDAPVHVRSLKIESADLAESDRLQIIQTFQGSTYPLEELMERIRHHLYDRGHAKATVELLQPASAAPGPAPRSMAVSGRISAGARYTLSGLSIEGAHALSQDEITRQLALHPGDLFSSATIGKGLERLRNLYQSKGYANIGIIPRLHTDESRHTYTLTLEIDEGKPTAI